ncbi:MAG: MFS transporter [Chloroflexi bacterium]|nr:MFS transporter [Chloroflexota bacterium]
MSTEDITLRLDKLSTNSFHWKLLIVSGLGWMFDAMDVGIISFVVAALAKEWKLSSIDTGNLISIGLLGMFLGAALSGTIADRYGRKLAFQLTLLIYSVATGLSALASGFLMLLGLRFIVGFGLGGELPVASTMISEFAPAKDRGRMLVLLESFWAYGWVLAALVGYLVIPQAGGWRIAFLIGTIPALYVFILRRAVPESPRFLISKGRHKEAAEVIRQAEGGSGAALAPWATDGGKALEVAAAPTGFGELWKGNLLRRTVMLWILWFGMVYSYYGIFTWLPTLLAKNFSLIRSFEFTLIITLAQIPGYFSAAYLVEKIGRKATLASYLFLCAISAYLYGQSSSVEQLLICGSLMSFFNLGAWGVIYTYTPELYPTRVRGTGVGFSAAFGRIGGIIGPLVVGFLLAPSFGGTTSLVFSMFAVFLLIIAADVALLGEETKGKTLEQIAQ